MTYEESVERSGINVALTAITELSPVGRPPLLQEAADLHLQIAKIEKISPALISFTHLCENSFGVHPALPNTNHKPESIWNWDIGPWQLNLQWSMRSMAQGEFTLKGMSFGACFGTEFYESNGITPCAFSGTALANGRLAARKLLSKDGTDRFRAVAFTGPDHQLKRGELWDLLIPYFENLFHLYGG